MITHRHVRFGVLCGVTAALMLGASSAQAGDLYVLAVGVNTYGAPSGLADLRYAVADATELEAVLRAQEGRSYRKVNSFLLTQAQATRENVVHAMNTIRERAKADDTVIALFSGSGYSVQGRFHFPLHGSDPQRRAATGLEPDDFQAFFAGTAANTLLLVDSCEAGVLTRELAGRSPPAGGERRLAIGAADGLAFEEGAVGHGLLTLAALEALQGRFEASAAARAGVTPTPGAALTSSALLAYATERTQDLGRRYQKTPQVPVATSAASAFALTGAERGAPSGDLYLLAVGVNSYEDVSIGALNYAAKDSADLAAFFRSQQGKAYRKVNATLLTNESATRRRILDALDEIVARATPDDTVILSFSMHGQNAGSDYYLLTHDTRVDNLGATALSGRQVFDAYARTRANTLLILDSCFSGFVAGTRATTRSNPDAFVGRATSVLPVGKVSKTIISAASSDEEANEGNGLPNGYFTFAFLEALQGKAKGSGEGVALYEALGYTATRVPALVRERGGKPQEPNISSGRIPTWIIAKP